jgi:CheY-like chemotaxis protein
VLVLDDEPSIRRFIKVALEDSGYEVVVTGDGAEAVTLFQGATAQGKPFGAVLLDLTIAGGMGGRETLAQLRIIDPAVRAIASSGYAAEEIMSDPRLHGFVGTLAKPYGMDELERAVSDARSALV